MLMVQQQGRRLHPKTGAGHASQKHLSREHWQEEAEDECSTSADMITAASQTQQIWLRARHTSVCSMQQLAAAPGSQQFLTLV
jgi:hypothetical protein